MELDDEDTEDGIQLAPGSDGMNVPSTCTILIIAGIIDTQKKKRYDNF